MTIYHVEMTCCGWHELHGLLSSLTHPAPHLLSEEQQLLLQTAHRRVLSFVFERGLSCGQRRYALLSEPEVKAIKALCTLFEDTLLAYLGTSEPSEQIVRKYERLTMIVRALAQAEPLSGYLIRRRS
ncbi:hypothetical protein GCM10027275_50200 [Rhabdobacter roseus]|uniref:Uncharacterized protein n=1 Tax=Rhabdobacter roseus TaxID=1655419 RepID=A0A840TZN3_9BACT|nr:hypothetical protein [Rhabdobacter roseus]MBB5287092.1 hypothetical protein [Rhabdobacter roseus]